MFYLPPGSMMQLYDGRVLHKDHKTNMWKDNMGVPITEQQLHFMMSFPSFSDDPSGGGDSPVVAEAPAEAPPEPPEPPANLFDTALSNIVITDNTSEVRTNTVIFNTSEGLSDITAVFSEGLYNLGCEFNAYVNGVLQTTIFLDSRPPNSPGDVPGDPNPVFACSDGDQVQFGVISPNSLALSFDVTIQKHPPSGPVVVLDTFNVTAAFNS